MNSIPAPQSRNRTITYLKALCILLMVFVHSGSGIPFFDRFPSMFHMPCFFFAVGYCFKRKYLEAPKQYFLRRVKGVYWPFVKWGLLFLAFQGLFEYLHFVKSADYGLVDYLHRAFDIVCRIRSHPKMLGGYWFLTSLFWGSLFAWVYLRLFRDTRIAALMAFLVLMVFNYTHRQMPFLDLSAREFHAAFLIVIGHVFAERKVQTFSSWVMLAVLVLAVVGTFQWRLHFSRNSYESLTLLLYAPTSVLSVWTLYSLFVRWKETDSIPSRAMDYVGNHTLEILTWHFLCFKFVSVIIVMVHRLPVERIEEFPTIIEYSTQGWWALYVFLGVFVPLSISYFVEKLQAKFCG